MYLVFLKTYWKYIAGGFAALLLIVLFLNYRAGLIQKGVNQCQKAYEKQEQEHREKASITNEGIENESEKIITKIIRVPVKVEPKNNGDDCITNIDRLSNEWLRNGYTPHNSK